MDANTAYRSIPLVLLGVAEPSSLEAVAARLRGEGMGLAFALGERGCLRVATAIGPDIILLDPRLSRGLLSLLRAHPDTRRARISWSHALAGRTLSDWQQAPSADRLTG